jgi:hypothetical protein
MNTREIEHMWKVASNNPNHDTHWHDPVVVSFANLVAKHTLSNIDPSKFMSYQEAFEAGRLAERDKWMERAHTMILGEREACANVCEAMNHYMDDGEECAAAIRARGNT